MKKTEPLSPTKSKAAKYYKSQRLLPGHILA